MTNERTKHRRICFYVSCLFLVLNVFFFPSDYSKFYTDLVEQRAVGLPVPTLGDILTTSLKRADSQLPSKYTINGESFSACLLFMEDDHRLTEWIAYHYFALALRRIIISVDPMSQTYPNVLIERWRERFIDIDVWNDTDFLGKKAHELRMTTADTVDKRTERHVRRQSLFYKKCTEQLRRENRNWTAYHDIDEYLSINVEWWKQKKHATMSDIRNLQRTPGHILQVLQGIRADPSVRPVGDYYLKAKNESYFLQDCVVLPRSDYTAWESNDTNRRRDVPSFVTKPEMFDTLRFNYRSPVAYGPGKSLMRVSQINESDMNSMWRVHRPLPETFCKDVYNFPEYNGFPVMRLHHYIGSWESYSFRNDVRNHQNGRSRKAWEARALPVKRMADFEIRPWLQGFVDMVGDDVKAKALLSGVGQFSVNHTPGVELVWIA